MTNQELSDLVIQEMQTNTMFLYNQELSYSPCSYTKNVSRGDIEALALQGDIAVSDAFIIYGITRLGFCNTEMLLLYLKRLKKEYTDCVVPVTAAEHLKARVKVLARYGLVRAFEYVAEDKKTVINLFCASEAGVQIMQRMLVKKVNYDALMSSFPLVEVFRKMACNYVGLSLMNNAFCEEYITGEDVFLGKNIGSLKTYSKMYYKDRDGKRYLAYVEPLFFSIDSTRMTDASNVKVIKERLVMFDRHISYVKANYEDIRMIFVVENISGVKKGLEIMTKYCSETFIDNAWFTTDRVLFKNKRMVSKSFIRAKLKEVEDGQYRLLKGLATHPIILSNAASIELCDDKDLALDINA